jgi:hypothetical protein
MAAVRVPDASYQVLKRLAEGGSLQTVLVEAIEDLRRKRLLEATNRAFAALRDDPDAWRDEQGERDAWDATLADGLESD